MPSIAAGFSEPSRMTCAPLTREDVRDELKHFLWESFAHEIKDLGNRVQQDVRREIHRFLEESGTKERHQPYRYLDNGLAMLPPKIAPPENEARLVDVRRSGSSVLIQQNSDEPDLAMRNRRLSESFEERITRYTQPRKPSKPQGLSAAGRLSKSKTTGLLQLPALNDPRGKASKYTGSAKIYPAPEEGNNQASQIATLQDMTPKALRRSDSSSSEEITASAPQAWSENSEGSAGGPPARPPRTSGNSITNGMRKPSYIVAATANDSEDTAGSHVETTSDGKNGESGCRYSSSSTSRNSVKQFQPGLDAETQELAEMMYATKTVKINTCTKVLAAVVKSENFDYFMGFWLVLNAVILGVQVDVMAQMQEKNSKVPFHFRVFDWVFCVVFSAELLARLIVHGGSMYIRKGWGWHVFDTIIVVFQLIEELTILLFAGTKVQKLIDNLGVLNMLRLGRIVLLLRMVRLIPELKSMVYLISASMNAFFWTVVLLFLMMYIVAVYYTQLAANLARDNPDLAAGISGLWGSVMQSILSLYQAITGGDDWCNFIEVFRGSSSGMFIQVTLVFTIYIAFATLVMLNLVTGVFVEGAQRIIKEDKDTELIRHVCRLFVLTDQDGSQGISWVEFQEHLEDKGMNEYFKAVDLSRQEAKDLFKLLDVDHSGTISVEEFVRGCIRLRGPARSVDLAALVYDFKMKSRKSEEHMLYIEESMARLSKTLQMIWRSVADIQPVDSWAQEVEGILV